MSKCLVCNQDLTPETKFCPACGTPRGRKNAGAYPVPHPLVAGCAVFGLSAIVSILLWHALSLPTRFFTSLIPVGSCGGIQENTFAMYLCSMKVAFLTLLGPLVCVTALWFARKRWTPVARRWLLRLPPEARFLAPPLFVTVLFETAWSGAHYTMTVQGARFPQSVFPAVVVLCSFYVYFYNAKIQARLAPVFEMRDRFPAWARLAATLAVALFVSRLVNSTFIAWASRQQVVTLTGFLLGYLALAPRVGRFRAPAGA